VQRLSNRLYTIGYSPFIVQKFTELLEKYAVTAVVDVRSMPYSRFRPEFNKAVLEQSLSVEGIDYFFLGNILGGRPQDDEMYKDGRVLFSRVAKSGIFQQGLERLREIIKEHTACLMCAEKDPITCHRTILVCRQLRDEFALFHILEDGALEDHHDAERRLVKTLKIPTDDLFRTEEELIHDAYEMQGKKIGYKRADLV